MRLIKQVMNKFKITTEKDSNSLPEHLIHAAFIDSPNAVHVSTKKLHVEGWVIPTQGHRITNISVVNNGVTSKLKYGKERPDVADIYREFDVISLKSGFYGDIQYTDGDLSIVINFENNKSETIFNSRVIYSPEDLADMVKNPNLAEYMADHTNLLRVKKDYYFEPNNSHQYLRTEDEVRPVAFYLPQFHPIPENDQTWGKGFTEWDNVTSAVPRFVGHQQPILPQGLGFYDLRVEDTIKKQIELARDHGIYGFCFYYYWFSGKKILDTPLNTFLKNKEWDFNFCICWANENWTKKWDGREKEVIISQSYLKSDPLDFIKDVSDILNDERYITHDGKPVLVVYRASELKNPREYVRIWRDYFREKYNKELYLVASMGFETEDPRTYGFDIGLDFAPQTNFFKEKVFTNKQFPYINTQLHYLDQRFNGSVTLYSDTALNDDINKFFDFPVINSVAPSWDNDARRNGAGFVMYGSNPDLYGVWLHRAISQAMKTNEPMVFINAWNEWAEGAILEPSRHFGYANLNRTSEILAIHSKDSNNRKKFPLYGYLNDNKGNNIALAIHIDSTFDAEYVRKEVIERLTDLPLDIYITVIKKFENEAKDLAKSLSLKPRLRIVPDRGKDLWPFLFTISRFNNNYNYNYVLKLHIGENFNKDKEHINNLVGTVMINKIKSSQQTNSHLSVDKDDVLVIKDSFWIDKDAIKDINKKGYILEDFGPELSESDGQDIARIRANITEIVAQNLETKSS